MRRVIATAVLLAACATRSPSPDASPGAARVDTTRVSIETIAAQARFLSTDGMRGRGPWTTHNASAARVLEDQLQHMGARPLLGASMLVPFVADMRPADTVNNVVAILPARNGRTDGELIGITAHFDHLGVGKPDATGDSIYNGFLDAALPVAMVLDVARRYHEAPGDRPLVVMFFNLEEQGLLGSKAFVSRSDAADMIARLRLLIGVDAGSPAGEAIEWQFMGALPLHAGARLADSLARARGWTTTQTAPRPISDVFPFSQRGVPILFPIPGRRWRGYTDADR